MSFKFSLTEKPAPIKWNWKKHKSIIVWRISQFDFTCSGFLKTISRRPITKIASGGYFMSWGISWAGRKKILTKVMNFATNKVNSDRRRKNLNGWEPSSTDLTLLSTSTFTWPVKMTSWSSFWISPVTSWSIAWESPVTSSAKRNKSWESRSSTFRTK